MGQLCTRLSAAKYFFHAHDQRPISATSRRVMAQGVVAVIKLQEGLPGPTAELAAEACTPLRPSHVADLRDPALAEAGVDKGALVKGGLWATWAGAEPGAAQGGANCTGKAGYSTFLKNCAGSLFGQLGRDLHNS